MIGECGADDAQLRDALLVVRARGWRALTRWPGSYLALARRVRARLDGAPVDVTALAAHFAFGQPDLLADRSLFRDVKRVPGGHLLLLGPDGAAVERYEPVTYPVVDLRQQALVVRAALAEAVAATTEDPSGQRGPGGLDSTTLACLAAQRGP
ncbi:hypothetical protein ACWEP4_30660 [Streptomyces sp. NPDC004227]